jgi:hypothetical protein
VIWRSENRDIWSSEHLVIGTSEIGSGLSGGLQSALNALFFWSSLRNPALSAYPAVQSFDFDFDFGLSFGFGF